MAKNGRKTSKKQKPSALPVVLFAAFIIIGGIIVFEGTIAGENGENGGIIPLSLEELMARISPAQTQTTEEPEEEPSVFSGSLTPIGSFTGLSFAGYEMQYYDERGSEIGLSDECGMTLIILVNIAVPGTLDSSFTASLDNDLLIVQTSLGTQGFLLSVYDEYVGQNQGFLLTASSVQIDGALAAFSFDIIFTVTAIR